MTNLEHLIENTLDAFAEGRYTAEQIMNFIKVDTNLDESGITAEQCYEICQYVWCTYLDNGKTYRDPSHICENCGYGEKGKVDVWCNVFDCYMHCNDYCRDFKKKEKETN